MCMSICGYPSISAYASSVIIYLNMIFTAYLSKRVYIFIFYVRALAILLCHNLFIILYYLTIYMYHMQHHTTPARLPLYRP